MPNSHEGGREAKRAAFKECKEAAGIVKGEKPSEEARAKMKECLKSKGIKKGHKGFKKDRIKKEVRE